ncbi:type II toxin-antitoxin system ParD family antitoxin [Dyadobacter jiangsuensis]|uniref:Antitoxin of ParD toxin-antitoxin type II system n=1 Tax=Dyadobacter jiangsuensis TaxID=1591085 RepID=A0A2P8FN80_9BACT|nr:type II toxin-antitoxin system ParD family antitoxin [Dyadobacter jiangsuensis]PSL23162.1 antitoxin of ParD toxin-antitoxin type II system [Dyadobacter jiangsuensis]
MAKNKSISLGLHSDTRTSQDEKLRLLRQALINGEQSGWVHDFDPEEFKARMRTKNSA